MPPKGDAASRGRAALGLNAMVPTNGVASSRKSRTSTPPPQKGAAGNKKGAAYQELLKKPDVKSVDVKGLASSSGTSPPPRRVARSSAAVACSWLGFFSLWHRSPP